MGGETVAERGITEFAMLIFRFIPSAYLTELTIVQLAADHIVSWIGRTDDQTGPFSD